MTEDEILSLAARKAKRGEYFTVHKYKYRDEKLRSKVRSMTKAGKLVFNGLRHKDYEYYRPEDRDVLEKQEFAHNERMKAIHAKNVDWHLKQAAKYSNERGDPKSLYSWHIKQAEVERMLSI
jgi:hypothetical protein